MRTFRPLPDRHRPDRPLALIEAGTAGLNIATLDGIRRIPPGTDYRRVRRALQQLKSHRVFTLSRLRDVIRGTGACIWTGQLWNGRLVGAVMDDGPKIYSTRTIFEDYRLAEAFGELSRIRDFARHFRVHIGSFGWTAEQFYRYTLSDTINFMSALGRQGIHGGRKACPDPRPYSNCHYVDIRAAYPAAMIAAPFPRRLKLSRRPSLKAEVGMAQATVKIPPVKWPPLFRPNRIFGMEWRSGEYSGWWPMRELRTAADHGCDVTLHAAAEGVGYANLFSEWANIMMEARTLGGAAEAWYKTVAASLWGVFTIGGQLVEIRWRRNDMRQSTRSAGSRSAIPSDAGYIGGEICARVRQRIQQELVPLDPVYIDTDGGVVMAGAGIPEPAGDAIGQWSVRHRMRLFEPRAPQAYRWVDYQDREQIVLAGIRRATRRDLERFTRHTIASIGPAGAAGIMFRRRSQPIRFLDAVGNPVMIAGEVNPETLPTGWQTVGF